VNKELRTFVAQELRATGSDSQPRIEGYSAVFNTVTDIGGQFSEVIAPGAFKRSLADGDDVVCLIDHNSSLLLGRRSAGTLTLSEDTKGLKFTVQLPDTSVARDAYANLKAGNLKECSFGFYVDGPDGERWSQTPDGTPLRTLVSVRLFDVSVVTFPAYSGTGAAARNVVAEHVEARMAELTQANGDAHRRVRLQKAMEYIAEEQRQQEARDQAQAIEDAKLIGKFSGLRILSDDTSLSRVVRAQPHFSASVPVYLSTIQPQPSRVRCAVKNSF
jgi:HK97 family phage prohead protease